MFHQIQKKHYSKSTSFKIRVDGLLYLIKTQFQSEILNIMTVQTHKYVSFSELKYKYNVTNIPHVVAVKRDGSLITKRGKNEIEEIGINVLVTWIE